MLIVANKQDLDQSIDVIDITYFFNINELCNQLQTPCWIIPSGELNRTDLGEGMEWLLDNIIDNYKTLKNRMRFNGLLQSPITRFKRQRTSLPHSVRFSYQLTFYPFLKYIILFWVAEKEGGRRQASQISTIFVCSTPFPEIERPIERLHCYKARSYTAFETERRNANVQAWPNYGPTRMTTKNSSKIFESICSNNFRIFNFSIH